MSRRFKDFYCRPLYFVLLILFFQLGFQGAILRATAAGQPAVTEQQQQGAIGSGQQTKSDVKEISDKTKRSVGKSAKTKWIRIKRNAKKRPTALQTSIVRYQNEEGLTVDLISAVHVGDSAYYKKLNKEFEQYESVLYELVAPKERNVPDRGAGTTNRHPVGAMQNGLKSLLGLDHQLALIDYKKKNFVHADMSPDQFNKSMTNRGESFLGMAFSMMGQQIAQQSKDQADGKNSEMDLLMALLNPSNRQLKLKRIMAEQLGRSETMLVGFSGPDGSTIITERNKIALKVLAAQVSQGKKRLAIFYGGGHMPDFHDRLVKQFKLKPTNTRWLTAWDLN